MRNVIALTELVAMLTVTVSVAFFVLLGLKHFGAEKRKRLICTLAVLYLALDMLRFLVNASFYDKATTPATDVKFGYNLLYACVALFAAYHEGKWKRFFCSIACFTALVPFFSACFDRTVFFSQSDENGVLSGIFFAESGISLSIALLLRSAGECDLSAKGLFDALLAVGVFLVMSLLAYLFWVLQIHRNDTFAFAQIIPWLVKACACLLSVPLTWLCIRLIRFKTE